MSEGTDVIAERVRWLFQEARDHGADTDCWPDGPEVIDTLCDAIQRVDPQEALTIVERAHDPRWSRLHWYLQGLADFQALLGGEMPRTRRMTPAYEVDE